MQQQLSKVLLSLRECKQEFIKEEEYQKAYKKLKLSLKLKKKGGLALTREEFVEACQLCNLIAMRALKFQDYEVATKFLKEAQHYSKCSIYMLLVTHSNWGCYYKKTNSLELALEHSQKAVLMANKLEEVDLRGGNKDHLVADCHLNICAILSSMGRHQEAFLHATTGCTMLEEQSSSKSRHHVYLIGLFNLAVETQHLKNYQQALNTYIRLKKIILTLETENHFLFEAVDKAIHSLQIVIRKRVPKSRSQCLDPLSRTRKRSVLVMDELKCGSSVSSKLNITDRHPLQSTQLIKLPLLGDTQNTTKTLDCLGKYNRPQKQSSQSLKKWSGSTQRIIINKKPSKRDAENEAP